MTATKKRLLAALFAALMSLGVVACGGMDDGEEGDAGGTGTGAEETGGMEMEDNGGMEEDGGMDHDDEEDNGA